MDNELKNLGIVAKKGLGVLLRAAGLAVGITVAGGIVAGVIASTALLGTAGVVLSVFGGFAVGGWIGKAVAKNYVAKRSGPAIVVLGNVLDAANKELVTQGQKPLDIPGITQKFDDATKPAADTTAAAPVVVQPIVEAKAPTL